jgi:alpha-L-fucosidase
MADIGEVITVSGLIYTPKEDGKDGVIVTCSIEASEDGNLWSLVADEIMFDNIVNNPIAQKVEFDAPVRARYLRIIPVRVETGVGAVGVPSPTYGIDDLAIL